MARHQLLRAITLINIKGNIYLGDISVRINYAQGHVIAVVCVDDIFS